MNIPLPCASSFVNRVWLYHSSPTESNTATNVYTRLYVVFRHAALPLSTMRRRLGYFKEGKPNTNEDERSGSPSDAVNVETAAGIFTLCERERRYTTTNLQQLMFEEFYIVLSLSSIHWMAVERGFQKVCALRCGFCAC